MKIIVPDKKASLELFHKIDKSKDGKIQFEEIVEGLTAEGVSPKTILTLLNIFPHVDKDQDDSLDIDEFVKLLYILQNMEQEGADELTTLFLAADDNCSGEIDRSELRNLLQEFIVDIPSDKVDKVMKQYSEGGETISYDLFRQLLVDLQLVGE